MTVTGPDFIALQVRDLERSADFYENRLGMQRAEQTSPYAIVFATKPVAFAVRTPLPDTDLDAVRPRPGAGVALWLHAPDAQKLHDELDGAGVSIVSPPSDGPFGRMFTFIDPDGYAVTIHDKQ
jgi:catechol 2,3-dioxygenase-like lactoylglutathione lyase family enzyme